MWYYGGRIRIEPDWNVKLERNGGGVYRKNIRIEPDWNVKKPLVPRTKVCISLEQNQIGM